MTRIKINLALLTCLFGLSLTACAIVTAPSANLPIATPTETPVPTGTPTPTEIPSPTLPPPSPTATDTPLPTSTFTPMPTDTPTPTAPNLIPWHIMPMGDSLTSGNYPNLVHSYRGYLEVMLIEAGFAFDFVGTQSRPAHGGTDPDHEGYSGYTIGPDQSRFCETCPTANLYDHLETSLSAEPDIILLLVGINDMFPLDVRQVNPADAAGKLERFVQRIVELRPQVYIFVASLAPVQWTDGSDWPAYQAVNAAAERLGSASPVDRIIFVDMNRQLEASFDKSADFTDSVHWNESGARKVAKVWLDALVASGLLVHAP